MFECFSKSSKGTAFVKVTNTKLLWRRWNVRLTDMFCREDKSVCVCDQTADGVVWQFVYFLPIFTPLIAVNLEMYYSHAPFCFLHQNMTRKERNLRVTERWRLCASLSVGSISTAGRCLIPLPSTALAAPNKPKPGEHSLQLNPLALLALRFVALFWERFASTQRGKHTHTHRDIRLTCQWSLIEHVDRCVTGTIHLAICFFPVFHGQILLHPSCNQGQNETQAPFWGLSLECIIN